MSWFFSAMPYILAAGVILDSLLRLLKEWEDYKNKKVRRAVVVVFVIVGALTFVSLHKDRQEKEKTEEHIKNLEGQATAANDAQKENTKLFLDSFHKLSGEVSDLKTQVRTEALQKKLTTVEAELQNTQKALAPGPKAKLAFSFYPFTNPPVGLPAPVTVVTLPVLADGSVHVQFSILNLTDVDAVDGELTLQICDQCKFAKEPAEFTKLAGSTDTQRYMSFQRILAAVAFHTLSVDVIMPPSIQSFQMGIQYRCRSCVLIKEVSGGTVHVVRLAKTTSG